MAQGMGAEEARAAAGQLAEALPGIVPEQLPGPAQPAWAG